METQKEEKWKPGTIRSIQLINFMCHASFELTFGPTINFIVGPNGSGKSAILTAIVAALGGRASITTRAKKANDFIMYGKPSAKIKLVLHNYDKIQEMQHAYKPEYYGQSIIIEKSIYSDAPARLVLKSAKGVKISDKKSELDDMLDFFGILINNPICILNQEVSKSFLHSKKPEDKFVLYMKATSLEQIQADYDEAQRSHNAWDEANQSKKADWRILDNEYTICKDKTKYILNRHKVTEQAEALNQEFIWAKIRDSEVIRDKSKRKRDKLNESIEALREDIDKRSEKIKNIECEIQILRDKIKETDAQISETKKKLENFSRNEFQIKSARLDVQHKINNSKTKIVGRTRDKDNLEKSINDYKEKFRAQNALDQDVEKRKMEIEYLEKELLDQRARYASVDTQTKQLQSSLRATEFDMHKADSQVKSVQERIKRIEAELSRLKNGQKNNLRKYGDAIVNLVAEIERLDSKGYFTRKPIGPLGHYLKLKIPDIAPSLEVQLGRNAHAFACDNQDDRAKLLALFRKFNTNFRQPPIITRKFKTRHDISRFKAVHRIYNTLLDWLEIERDEVFNAVLDRTGLESILFIPDYKEAENLMINQSSTLKNTRCAYTRDASAMYPRTASGGYKCIAHHNVSGSLFLENNAVQIKEREKELNGLNTELRLAKESYKSRNDSYAVQRAEYEATKNETLSIRKKTEAIEAKLMSLKTVVVIEPQEISVLEADLAKTLKEIDRLNLDIEREMETLTSIETNLKDAMRDKKECHDILERSQKQKAKLNAELEASRTTKKTFEEKVKENETIIESHKEQIIEENKNLFCIHEHIATLMQGMEHRPATIRPTDEVREEKLKLDAQLMAEEQAMQGNPAEILDRLSKRMEEIKNMKNIKDLNDGNFDMSSKALMDRREGLIRLQHYTTSAVNTTFTTVMRTLKMDGRLDIFMQDVVERGQVVKKGGTLEMHIDTNYNPSQRASNIMSDNNNNDEAMRRASRSQPTPARKRSRMEPPGSSEKENRMSDARSLSGGERSFSTVAFVLALWHHCSSPFKLMDEIDVFMDMVTRRVSYNALIRFAEATPNSGQFLFFSPLELPKFEDTGNQIRVFEMPVIVRKRPHSQISSDPQPGVSGM